MPGCKFNKYQIVGYELGPIREILSGKWLIRRCDLMKKVWAGVTQFTEQYLVGLRLF